MVVKIINANVQTLRTRNMVRSSSGIWSDELVVLVVFDIFRPANKNAFERVILNIENVRFRMMAPGPGAIVTPSEDLKSGTASEFICMSTFRSDA
jgi:hypothetical protein